MKSKNFNVLHNTLITTKMKKVETIKNEKSFIISYCYTEEPDQK